MSRNIMSKKMIDRLFLAMKSKGVSTNNLCKALNIHYCDFKAMIDGKIPCYGKWQKKIADVLETDREFLFCEFRK